MATNLLPILRSKERNAAWLGRKVGCSRQFVYQVIHGIKPAPAEFRRRAAAVLEVPEAVLFPADDVRLRTRTSPATLNGAAPVFGATD